MIFENHGKVERNVTILAILTLIAVMIGGLLASIVFTFILVPVVFWYLERFERRFIKH